LVKFFRCSAGLGYRFEAFLAALEMTVEPDLAFLDGHYIISIIKNINSFFFIINIFAIDHL
jgi:hypothetical protein